ncbi:hypothetical protein E2C01_074239 [Portunus trituberculatus]|uniref:Uncharacterized protein n=1 Tax=Portunus trituberculatus TaxID=210409 RepID=A0A5B7IFT3_PORTR|nr:hypothetical protein [Portunus trituberculatus]
MEEQGCCSSNCTSPYRPSLCCSVCLDNKCWQNYRQGAGPSSPRITRHPHDPPASRRSLNFDVMSGADEAR